jgi:hypothetical protein
LLSSYYVFNFQKGLGVDSCVLFTLILLSNQPEDYVRGGTGTLLFLEPEAKLLVVKVYDPSLGSQFDGPQFG